MTNVLGQLLETIETAIAEGRKIAVGMQHGNNRIMTSFVPVEYELNESLYIKGEEDDSINLDIDKWTVNYNSEEEEFQLKYDDVFYYFALI